VEITLRHTTFGRTPLDDESARRRTKQLTLGKDICKKEASFVILLQSPSYVHFCEVMPDYIRTAETSSMFIWRQLCSTVSVFWQAD